MSPADPILARGRALLEADEIDLDAAEAVCGEAVRVGPRCSAQALDALRVLVDTLVERVDAERVAVRDKLGGLRKGRRAIGGYGALRGLHTGQRLSRTA